MLQNMTKRLKGGFTLIELMVVVAIIGILAAVAIPAFMRNARKAKTGEATTNVKKLYDGARAYYEGEKNQRGSINPIAKQFPIGAAAGDTAPAANSCCGQPGDKCAPNPGDFTGASDLWSSLTFSIDDPHYYWYTYIGAGTSTASQFTAAANGNLDCDAEYSTFELVGSIQADGTVTGSAGLYQNKELE